MGLDTEAQFDTNVRVRHKPGRTELGTRIKSNSKKLKVIFSLDGLFNWITGLLN